MIAWKNISDMRYIIQTTVCLDDSSKPHSETRLRIGLVLVWADESMLAADSTVFSGKAGGHMAKKTASNGPRTQQVAVLESREKRSAGE